MCKINGGNVEKLIGVYGLAESSGITENAYGGFFEARDVPALNVDNAYGIYSTVHHFDTNAANINTGYGLYTECKDANTCYGLYVKAGDGGSVVPAIDWGIYIVGEDKNYISGYLGIGTTNPLYKLDISSSTSDPVARFLSSDD